MRREWTGWIKERRWEEFERLAKKDPTQDLADTVAEMERGFPDKPDRKALRKVLFLLRQAGYEPQEIETGDVPAAAGKPFEVGFLVSADAAGDSVVTYGYEQKGRVRWLVAHVNGQHGVTRAREEDVTLDEALAQAERSRASDPAPFVAAEVPAEYALGRIAQAVARTRMGLPPVVAFWRAALPKEWPGEHPAEALPRDHATEDDRRNAAIATDATLSWRLELGVATPVLEELQRVYNETRDEEARREATEELIASTRERIFTPEVVEEHAGRLLDLAYLLHLRGHPGGGILLAAADDLRERGPESDYAKALLDKTVVLLVETLRRSADRAKAANAPG
jgi:hypothetical protein